MWSVVKSQLDFSLKELYERQADAGVKVLTWLRNKRHILALFVDECHIEAACNCDGKFGDIPHDVKAIVMGSATGKCMFKNVWLGCARSSYVKEVVQSLADLQHNDFSEAELQNFKGLMAQKVAALKSHGHRRLSWRMHTQLMGQDIYLDMDDPNDEWALRLHCWVKTIAINSRQLAPLWYEELLVPQQSLESVPGFLVLPESFLDPFRAARGTLADLLDGVDDLSVAIRIATQAADTLVDLDRSFECDPAFLTQAAEPALQRRMMEEVLNSLPGQDGGFGFDEVGVPCHCLGGKAFGREPAASDRNGIASPATRYLEGGLVVFVPCKLDSPPGAIPPAHKMQQGGALNDGVTRQPSIV